MEVIIVDDLPPEVVAMVQALYSRSPKSILEHLEDVKKRGPEKFMKNFYVGYGHKSIGDCGTTTFGIQKVSMLVAKAVQDSPLYSGQEASTRYLDFTAQGAVDPLGTPESAALQRDAFTLYFDALDALKPVIRERYPRKSDEDEKDWEKTVAARVFDIGRSLLLAGARTSLSWHGNLRQVYDHSKELRNHPLAEPAAAGRLILQEAAKKYPSSFSHTVNEAEEAYIRKSMERFAYFFEPIAKFSFTHNLDFFGLGREHDLLSTRPPRTELHQRFRQYGTVTFKFPLDFGSYRDIQRHRSSIQEMPLLTTKLGFHPWYLENLPEPIRDRIEPLRKRIDALDADERTKQYYTPMGYLVPIAVTCPLPSAVYIAELRSGKTVHPTLRMVAQQMGDTLENLVPGLAMHHDRSEESWSVKRGRQDIVKLS